MNANKAIATGGILGGAVALGYVLWKQFSGGNERPVRDPAPDMPLPAAPGSTGYKLIDKILPQLRVAAAASGIPLGLLVGWIAKESGGKLSDTTSLDERGYFQLMPSESKSIGVDHQRLSTDSDYSIDAGIKLVKHYMSVINALDLPSAPAGSSYYWKLVKLAHSMGGGQTKKVVTAAKAAGEVGSWDALEKFATAMSISGPKPSKWFPFVDKVYAVGRSFGFGNDASMIAGNGRQYLAGIIEGRTTQDREALARAIASEVGDRTREEQTAAAWSIRNAADASGKSVSDYLTAGDVSTRRAATERSRAIAAEVLDAEASKDPTGGAVDFWCPALQRKLAAMADAYRAAIVDDDLDGIARLERYADYGDEDDVRSQQARDGLRVLRVVGVIELLGRAP